MNTGTRLKLEMAARVLDFCRAHPSDDPEVKAVAGQLEDLLTRARALEQQVVASRAADQESARQMRASRETISEMLQQIAGAMQRARAADRE
ncbi:MAG: hypothetical protein ABI742_10840 [Gemmatimonadota bacterium]